jgi:hypothetical protein
MFPRLRRLKLSRLSILVAALLASACSGSSTPGITWTAASQAPSLNDTVLNGVAAGAGGVAAVGSNGSDAVVLISSDGSAWSRLSGDVFTGVNLSAVAADGNGFVAVGQPTNGGTQASSILRSTDGQSFVNLHVDLLTVQLTTVAVSGSTYIAAGRKFHCQLNEAQSVITFCGYVFLSSDGTTWAPGPTGPQFDDSEINAVVAGGPGFVAVGYAPDAARAVAWTSANGADWTRSPDSPAFDNAAMLAVTAGGPGFVAVGFAGSQGSGAAVWTSPDGAAWTRVPDSAALAGAQMQSVVNLGTSLVGAGWSSDGAAVWTSADGTTWTKAPTAASFADTEMVSLAVSGKTIVAVGPPTINGITSGIWTSPSGK